jgi:hypothetical protein
LSVEISWVPWASILAVVMTVVLTLLEVMGCTALGLATSAITRRGSTATFSAILLRFSPVVLLAWFTRNELGSAADNAYRVLRFAPFAIADGGTAPLSRLSVPYTPFSLTTHLDALYGLFMATVVMITFLVMSLCIAPRETTPEELALAPRAPPLQNLNRFSAAQDDNPCKSAPDAVFLVYLSGCTDQEIAANS